ncbi:ABC transporter ATP-binding protein, partial [Brevibacterium sp.]|uniref:ABC transporter ATP-binding protein n=1 Tax=Brevibacterium sp. TaxID=1701 RepID=UPI0025BAFD38
APVPHRHHVRGEARGVVEVVQDRHDGPPLRLQRLQQPQGRTVVAVLHDLDHAARFATHVVAMRDGRTVASGTPAEILTEQRVREVFGLDCRILTDPDTGTPVVLPR